MKVIIKPLVLASICFFAGYQFAVFRISPESKTVTKPETTASQEPSNNYQESDSFTSSTNDSSDNKSLNIVQSNRQLEITKDSSSTDFFEEPIRDDVDAMLTNLENLRANNANSEEIATQFDALKTFLIKNPNHIGDLVSQLDRHSANSDAFDNILSVITTLPSEHTDPALLSMAEQYQYAGPYDKNAQTKFLTALSNMSTTVKSAPITQSLFDIAMLQETDTGTKLQALNLVSPYQLQDSDKTELSNELLHLVNNANDQEVDMLLPHLLRFSKKEQRTNIASNLLSQNNTESTRNSVLSSINSGSIPTNDSIKAILFEIANAPDDSLRHKAAETLKYQFELSREEYSQL